MAEIATKMKSVPRRTLFLFRVLAALSFVPTLVSGQAASRAAHPGFDGIWNSATATPLERPRQFKDKPFFASDEAAEWDPLDPANASPVVAWLCSEESGWLSGAVLRIDGNTVRRVNGWTVEGGYTATSGQALDAAELGLGVRKLYGAAPLGLGG